MNEQEFKERTKKLALRVILVDAEVVPPKRLESLLLETDQIVAMTVASIKTLRSKRVRLAKSKI
jgi:hypothetical protein